MEHTPSWNLKNQVHRQLANCFILTTWRSGKKNVWSSNQPYVAFASFLVGLRYAICTIFVQRSVHDVLAEPSWILGDVGFLLTLASACAYSTPFLVIIPLYCYQRQHDVDMIGHLDDDVDVARLSKLVSRVTWFTRFATRYAALAMMMHLNTLSLMTFKIHGSYLLLVNYMVQSTLLGLFMYLHIAFSIGMFTMAMIVALSLRCRFKRIWRILDTHQAEAAQEAGVLFKHILEPQSAGQVDRSVHYLCLVACHSNRTESNVGASVVSSAYHICHRSASNGLLCHCGCLRDPSQCGLHRKSALDMDDEIATPSWMALRSEIHHELENCFILTTWRNKRRGMMWSNQMGVAIFSLVVSLRYVVASLALGSWGRNLIGDPLWILGDKGRLWTFSSSLAASTCFLVGVPLYRYQCKTDVVIIGYLSDKDVKKLSKLLKWLTIMTKYSSRLTALSVTLFYYVFSAILFTGHRSYLILLNYLFQSGLFGIYTYLLFKFLMGMMTLTMVVAVYLHCKFKRIWRTLGRNEAKAAKQAVGLFKHISHLNELIKCIVWCVNFVWAPAMACTMRPILMLDWYLKMILIIATLSFVAVIVTVVACVTQVNVDARSTYKLIASKAIRSRCQYLREVMRYIGSDRMKVGFQYGVFYVYTRKSFYEFIMNCIIYYLMATRLTY
ncbi:hypothetical protein HDE_09288 [Halotydeus destructor]|nr:hypothetical protein HDE_09288 [Halotydeus destructor]